MSFMRRGERLSAVMMLVAAALVVPLAARCVGQTQPVTSTSNGETQPANSPEVRLRAAKESLVLATVCFNGRTYASPGVVFHRRKDQALVAVRQFEELEKAYARQETVVGKPEYFILVGEGSQRQSVRCQRVSAFTRHEYCVLSAPADRLPPPMAMGAVPELTPQTPVYVSGYEIDRLVQPPAYADFTEKGIIQQVNRDREGKVVGVDMKCPEVPALSFAAVVTASGELVGFSTKQHYVRATDEFQHLVTPPNVVMQLLDPQITFLALGFESGDTKQVVYEFVAVINDPCDTIGAPRLSVLGPLDEPPGDAPKVNPGERIPVEKPEPIDTLPNSKRLDLARKSPSKAYLQQYSWVERFGSGYTWVARFPAANPGPKREYVFRGQLCYVDKSGTTVYTPPGTLEFSISNRVGDAVPDIPGIDGKPIDCPRPVRLADGSYRVTSEITRVDPGAVDVKAEVPQPVVSGKKRASKLPGAGGGRTIALDVAPGEELYNVSVPVIPAVFSPDGAWLYVVDGNSVIRKIGTADFVEDVFLDIAAPCKSLGYSRAGLVAAAAKMVYVLDPATLKVKHAIATDGARMIAASPSTGVGFAEGRVETRELGHPSRTYFQLLMLDFDAGRILHRVKNGPGPSLRVGEISFDSGLGTPYLSKDGKRLYLGGHYSDERLHRFRVDGEDLVYERTIGLFPRFMNDDGAITLTRNFPTYFVHDIDEPDRPRFKIDAAKAGPGAIDPKSGAIYVLDNTGGMRVFDSTGKQVANLVVSDGEMRYLLPHPGGQRLLGWGRSKVFYYDLEPGRLPEIGDSHPEDEKPSREVLARSPLTGELRPLAAGNLVTSMRTSFKPLMFELTPQGKVVQSIDVPKPPDAESVSNITDLVVAPDRSLHVILLCRLPATTDNRFYVASLGADRKEWRFSMLPTKESPSLTFVGDIELRENGKVAVLVSLSDAFLLDPGETSGTPVAIPSGHCMAFGPDGTYYTFNRRPGTNAIHAYDLKTLRKTREIETSEEPATIAVDQDGNVYLARYTTVTKISADGSRQQLKVSKNWSGDAINDIALSSEGKLAMGSRSGKLFTVDRDLSEESLFAAADENLAGWVAWIPGKPSKPAAPPSK